MISLLEGMLYPRRCPVCHGIPEGGREICAGCVKKLPYIEGRRCAICGRPVEEWERLCEDCSSARRSFDAGMGVFYYDDIMRGAVSYLKYKGRLEYGEVLGTLMAEAASAFIKSRRIDLVVPVPVHEKRLRERGYNQAGLLAAPVSRIFGIPMDDGLLVRTGQTEAMKRLGAKGRRENLKGAFAAARGHEIPGSALIVDDIFTTGATVDECSAELKRAGCRRVFFLSLAQGGGRAAAF